MEETVKGKQSGRVAAPKDWSADVVRFWRAIVSGWDLTDEGREILQLACEARERMAQADAVLARDGLTIRTARGTIRAHPATRIRREAEGTFLAALRQLGLEGR